MGNPAISTVDFQLPGGFQRRFLRLFLSCRGPCSLGRSWFQQQWVGGTIARIHGHPGRSFLLKIMTHVERLELKGGCHSSGVMEPW